MRESLAFSQINSWRNECLNVFIHTDMSNSFSIQHFDKTFFSNFEKVVVDIVTCETTPGQLDTL